MLRTENVINLRGVSQHIAHIHKHANTQTRAKKILHAQVLREHI